jgi:hypothetical protein
MAVMKVRRALVIARLQGAFNTVGGLWPIMHIGSFEAVLGPKADRWLVYTVAGLMVCIGAAQLATTADPASIRQSRRIGVGSALTLGAIDVLYVAKGRISKTYLLDALLEGGWILAWARTTRD